MEPAIRKRVTRVGSGAFSIYLPKKWIDAWTPTQQDSRGVDLHAIGDSMLIVPVHRDRRLQATIEPTKKAARRWLLSAYIRGYNEVRLTPADDGGFPSEAITAGRDFLRHLDERILAECTRDALGFRIDPRRPPATLTTQDALHVMASTFHDMLALAEDAVRTYGIDSDRCLHSLGLLKSMYDEDLSRQFHQAMRMVATIDLPVDSVTDFQVLDLLAADLHRMGDKVLHMAETILATYGLTIDDLAYPRDHLLERVGDGGARGVIARQIVQSYPRGFTEARALFDRFAKALDEVDIPTLAALIGESYAAQERVQQRIFDTVVENWGEGDIEDPATAAQGFAAYRLSVPLTNVMGAIATTSRHALGLLTAAAPARDAAPQRV